MASHSMTATELRKLWDSNKTMWVGADGMVYEAPGVAITNTAPLDPVSQAIVDRLTPKLREELWGQIEEAIFGTARGR